MPGWIQYKLNPECRMFYTLFIFIRTISRQIFKSRIVRMSISKDKWFKGPDKSEFTEEIMTSIVLYWKSSEFTKEIMTTIVLYWKSSEFTEEIMTSIVLYWKSSEFTEEIMTSIVLY